MSHVGQQLRFRNVRNKSAYPPIAALKRTCPRVAFVPKAAVSRRSIRTSYSITSSAMARSVDGTFRPTALAVLRLNTSSNLTGTSTGSSLGCSPRRMRCV
jgi:hypothetical protein